MRWDLIIYDETRWATAIVDLKGWDETSFLSRFIEDFIIFLPHTHHITLPIEKKILQITCNWTRKKAAERRREYFEPWQYILDHPDNSRYSSKTCFFFFSYTVFFSCVLCFYYLILFLLVSLSPLLLFSRSVRISTIFQRFLRFMPPIPTLKGSKNSHMSNFLIYIFVELEKRVSSSGNLIQQNTNTLPLSLASFALVWSRLLQSSHSIKRTEQ